MKYFNHHTPLHQKGFSLIELSISITIFLILNVVVVTGYASFNQRVNTDTMAHGIAQWVRDAQISSMSVRRSSAGTFPPGYGLHFATAQDDQFIFFRDLDPDGTGPLTPNKLYDAGEIEQTITLLQGYTISSICGGHAGTAAMTCGGTLGFGTSNFVDVAFARPEPDAIITGQAVGGSAVFSPVRITVSSPKGMRRAIVIYATGQVSVQSAP
jgi:prepilin-type N-terminal cleavage/methylation domain-containing protein